MQIKLEQTLTLRFATSSPEPSATSTSLNYFAKSLAVLHNQQIIQNSPACLTLPSCLVCLAVVGKILPKSEENQYKSPATLQSHTSHSAILVLASFLIWGMKSYPEPQSLKFAHAAFLCTYGL